MVSPYLMRPIRSLDEIESNQPRGERLETLIGQALGAAKAAGYGPHEQIDRAAMIVLSRHPHLTTIDALAAVHRVRRQIESRLHCPARREIKQ